jgi:cation transport regulator ChaB
MNNDRRSWLDFIEDEKEKKDILDILRCAKEVHLKLNSYQRTKSDSDKVDLEGAEEDLKDTLYQIYQSGENEHNPLWNAILERNRIKSQIIGGKLHLFYAGILYSQLRRMEREERQKGNEETAHFFGKIAVRMKEEHITFFRVLRNGGVICERDENGIISHYFVGIPGHIRKDKRVSRTTHPKNLQAIKAAYEAVRDEAEKNIEEIDKLAEKLGIPR